MKRGLLLLLALSLVMFFMVGCSTDNQGTTVEPEDTGSEEEVVEEAPESTTVKLGLGVVNSIAKSRDADGSTTAMGQVDTTIAAATFDLDGRVIDVIIDNAQTRVNFDEELQVVNDKSAEIRTKAELKDDYGMRRVSGIEKEWFEQIAELEKWMVGKTLPEIKAMKVKEVDAAHTHVPDVPELTSLVTITIESYVAALEKAYANAIEVENAEKLGLGHNVSIAKSRGYSVAADGKETLPMAQVDTVMAATAFDASGKVVGTLIDNAQMRINFDADGKVTSDKTAELKTKAELLDDYGMRRVSGIDKEWFEQINELEKWMVGRTVSEIKSMNVKVVDEAHTHVPDVPELTSLVTITIESYIAAVEEAYQKAR